MREHGVFILIAAAAVLGVLVFVSQRRAPSPPRGELRTGPSASGSANSEPARAPMDASADRARDLQRNYWTPNPQEKSRLLARGVAALSWSEKLRLLHLTCLDELSTDALRRLLEDEDIDPEDMPAGPNRELVETLVADLRSAASPFRPRYAAIWKGKGGESEGREPDVEGVFENASLTHLGALEVVRLDAQEQPTELVFVPLDDLRGVLLASPAIFRRAKLFFDDGRPDEIVLVPMIYGISWSTSNAVHHDGSLTTFVAHVQRRGEDQARGVGLGHQDFVVSGDGARLMGLGAIGEIMVALSVDDPRFEQKCRARGLDPVEVRRESARKQ